MQPQTDEQQQQRLTHIVQQQMVIFGPQIALTKARKVPGLTITDDGTVRAIAGDNEAIMKDLKAQFTELSPFIVTQTIDPVFNKVESRITN